MRRSSTKNDDEYLLIWRSGSTSRSGSFTATAPVDVLRERITARDSAGQDASEATLAVLDRQLETFEPPDDSEAVIELATDTRLDDARLNALLDSFI